MDIYLAVPISNIVRRSCQIIYHFIISNFQIVLKINPFRSLLRNRKYYIHINTSVFLSIITDQLISCQRFLFVLSLGTTECGLT
jgi:hypothetical protein